MIGKTIPYHKILEHLGVEGMGVVSNGQERISIAWRHRAGHDGWPKRVNSWETCRAACVRRSITITGTARFEDSALVSHEPVTGNTEGISKVKETSTIFPGDSVRSPSSYVRDGAWVDGHAIVYLEDA